MTVPTATQHTTRSPRYAPAVGDGLERARHRAFVGRDEQLAAFHAALANRSASSILFVHGPGGTGKTALLGRLAGPAEASGRQVVRTGRFDPATSAEALAVELAGAEAASPVASSPAPVLLIDDFDRWRPAEGWLRDELLPGLPLGTVVVLAGRAAPALEWTTDPGWHELLDVHELGELSPAESVRLLRRRGVPRDQHDRLVALTGGHPLALLAGVAAQAGGATEHEVRLAVAQVVLDRVVGPPPTPAHRRALELCAQAGTVTQGALAGAGTGAEAGDPAELFGWLMSLPVVDRAQGGLRLRPFVRRAVMFERQWRDPATAGDVSPVGAAGAPEDGSPAAGTPVLPRDDFDAAVREALRSWRRPDLLAQNPLTASRLVADSAETDPVAALRGALRAGLAELADDPRESKGHRAVRATYLGGAPTQEAAAERLGLPFSTYRRHLGQGLTVLASLLWWRETQGEPTV